MVYFKIQNYAFLRKHFIHDFNSEQQLCTDYVLKFVTDTRCFFAVGTDVSYSR